MGSAQDYRARRGFFGISVAHKHRARTPPANERWGRPARPAFLETGDSRVGAASRELLVMQREVAADEAAGIVAEMIARTEPESSFMAVQVEVHFRGAESIFVSADDAEKIRAAMASREAAVTVRELDGNPTTVNVENIVRVEIHGGPRH